MNTYQIFSLRRMTVHIATGAGIALLALFLFATPTHAQANADYFWNGNADTDVRGMIALGDADPRQVAANLINVALGFLGIITVIIIIGAGFRYITSGGNEEARKKANSMLMSGVIGLIIILAAYSFADFLIESVVGATT
jgi:hypothetical protein